jgi:hypothetical protein
MRNVPKDSASWFPLLISTQTGKRMKKVLGTILQHPAWLVGAAALGCVLSLEVRRRLALGRRAKRKAEEVDEIRSSLTSRGASPEAQMKSSPLNDNDVDELANSLGLRIPEDDDLLEMLREDLLIRRDTHPWVHVRTSNGLRFFNLLTNEVKKYPPYAEDTITTIQQEIRCRRTGIRFSESPRRLKSEGGEVPSGLPSASAVFQHFLREESADPSPSRRNVVAEGRSSSSRSPSVRTKMGAPSP